MLEGAVVQALMSKNADVKYRAGVGIILGADFINLTQTMIEAK